MDTMIPMSDVLVWCALAFTLGMIYVVVAPVVYAVVTAVLFSRKYYRENPNVIAPTHKRLVRWALRGVR